MTSENFRLFDTLRFVGVYRSSFVVMAGYLWVSRSLEPISSQQDYVAIAGSVFIFLGACAALPINRTKRVIVAAGSLPLIAVGLFFFSSLFVWVIFHDCP